MKEMLRQSTVPNVKAGGQSSSDVDPLTYIQKLRQRKNKTNWQAGKPSMTHEIRSRDLAILNKADAHDEVASAVIKV